MTYESKSDIYLLRTYYKLGATFGLFSLKNKNHNIYSIIIYLFVTIVTTGATLIFIIYYTFILSQYHSVIDKVLSSSFYLPPMLCLIFKLWGLLTNRNDWINFFELISHLEIQRKQRQKLTKIINSLFVVLCLACSINTCRVMLILDSKLIKVFLAIVIVYVRFLYCIITLFTIQIAYILERRMDLLKKYLEKLSKSLTVKEDNINGIYLIKHCYLYISSVSKIFSNIFGRIIFCILIDYCFFVVGAANWFIYFKNLGTYLDIVVSVSTLLFTFTVS